MSQAVATTEARNHAGAAADRYKQRLAQNAIGGFSAASDLATCLLPLLKALKWKGNPRHIAESLPYFANELDLTGLRNVMATLNYSSRPESAAIGAIDPRLLPCLFIPDEGAALVVNGIDETGRIEVFDGGEGAVRHITDPQAKGTVYFFSPLSDAAAPVSSSWFRTVIERFRPLFWQAFFVTFLLNVLALSTPLFVMAIYDKVIGSGSRSMLIALAIGAFIAMAADGLLRTVRARILAFIGGRLDNVMGINILQHLLGLSPGFTERATIGAQIARLKDFESVREFFTGPLATMAMELPFAVFYFAVIFLLGGVLALVPIIGTLCFFVLTWVVLPRVRTIVANVGRAGARRQEFLIEILGKVRALKLTAGERTFLNRYRDMSARAAVGGFRNSMYTTLVTTLGNVIVVGSGMATIGVGVLGVIDGSMSMGGLIAAMMLVWRTLTPLQTVISLIQRIETVRGSIRQIDGLMNLKPERDPKAMIAPLKNLKGKVEFNRVSLRYSNDTDPAMVGVSFEAFPGEVVAVTGRNGSGKSTVLKLLLGLYQPQAGSVRIDNTDIRQIDPIELRHAIAYVPQTCNLFHGSISQNLRLAQPTATATDIRWACEMADVWEEIASLPKGLETRIGDSSTEHMSSSFVQKLSLARGYLKRSPIMLFDEPVNGLDFEGDRNFLQAVEYFRGQSTIFMVTHRPSHLKIADRILVFEAGYLRLAGPADEVRARIPPDLL